MAYKLFAVDLDGTLLRRDGTIHEDDQAALRLLQASGVPLSIVTGRLWAGTREAARTIDVRGPVACIDGSHIVDARDGRHLFSRPIAGAVSLGVRDVLARHAPASFLFGHEAIVHDAAGLPYAGYVRTWSPNIDVVERVTDHPVWEHEHGVMAVVAVGAEEPIRAATRELRELHPGTFVVSFPVLRMAETFALVVRAAGPTKGTALAWLAEHHGCTLADVVVVGDWLNDVPMFEVAGRSFVMGQAPAEVKKAATDHLVADVHQGGGVAEAVRRAFGIG